MQLTLLLLSTSHHTEIFADVGNQLHGSSSIVKPQDHLSVTAKRDQQFQESRYRHIFYLFCFSPFFFKYSSIFFLSKQTQRDRAPFQKETQENRCASQQNKTTIFYLNIKSKFSSKIRFDFQLFSLATQFGNNNNDNIPTLSIRSRHLATETLGLGLSLICSVLAHLYKHFTCFKYVNNETT